MSLSAEQLLGKGHLCVTQSVLYNLYILMFVYSQGIKQQNCKWKLENAALTGLQLQVYMNALSPMLL